MKKRRSFLNGNSKRLITVAVVIVVAVVFIVCVQAWRKNKEEEAKINRGIAYLESLDNRDVEAISAQIDKVKAEQSLALASSDENAVWQGFDSAMILGDSRAVGFRYFEFLLENQVIAESGRQITDVPSDIERVKEVSPKQIFLCFGLNDIKSEKWPEPTDYANAYKEVVAYLNTELPGTTVFINSILPAVGTGLESYAGYARIPEYNAALKAMAEENGYKYIDNTEVANQHQDLYEVDGLHLQKDFYKYWAANMLTGVVTQ